MNLPAWAQSWKSNLAAVLSAIFIIGPMQWPEWFAGHAHQIEVLAALLTSVGLLAHKDTSVVLKGIVEKSNINAAPDHPFSLETTISKEVGGVAKDAIDKALRFGKH